MKNFSPVWKWILIFLLAGIAVAAAFHFDASLQHWIQVHSNRIGRHWMREVSKWGDWPEHIAAGLILIAIGSWRGSKRWARIGLAMILACALAGVAARGIKVVSARARPSVQPHAHWEGPRLSSKYNSFPSGHTASTTAFFGTLLLASRRIGLLCLPIPIMIAASRIYVGAHYLSDIICAAILGILCAWFSAQILLRKT